MNLPNRLTVLRIVLVPILVLVYLFPYISYGIEMPVFTLGSISLSSVNLIVLIIYFIASITDALDGSEGISSWMAADWLRRSTGKSFPPA